MRIDDFSVKNGLKAITKETIENPSHELKLAIWEGLLEFLVPYRNQNIRYLAYPDIIRLLARSLQIPTDEIKNEPLDYIKERFKTAFFKLQGSSIYDIINFVSAGIEDTETLPDANGPLTFSELMNLILESKAAPCRFIDYELTLITDPLHMESVHKAASNSFKTVKTAIKDAANFLYEGKFKKCCREAIDGLEALLKNIINEPSADLNKAINDKYFKDMHPQLRSSIQNLYNCLSDNGVRHAPLDQNSFEPTLEEAKYVLIFCSNTINFISKKYGIDID